MKILQTNLLKIAVIALLSFGTYNQVVIDANKLCTCEQLMLENECGLFQQCSFQNSKCVTLTCDKIKTQTGCKNNKDCAWNKNKCSNFVSCTSYNAQTKTECNDLNHQCYYNSTSSVCQAPLAPITTSCSQNTIDFCYVGKEGVCALNGQTSCKEMKTCSEGNGDYLRCLLAWPACNWNSNTCTSAMTCKDAYPNDCLFAKKDINGNQFYLCDETDCSNFNVSKQTKDTCFYDSLGYYHWVNGNCTTCDASYNDGQTLALSLLALLSILY